MTSEANTRIHLAQEIDGQLESIDDGNQLFALLQSRLEKQASVELDFSDVQTILVPFLHASLGRLLQRFDRETLMQRLILCNVSEEQLQRINLYLDGTEKKQNQESTHDMMTELFEEDELGESIA